MVLALLRRSALCLATVASVAIAAPWVRALEPGTPLARLSRQAWSVENGLPQNTVPVLLQSRSGYLLAGTELGLARFDGVSFHVFDHATASGFPDAEIRCLLNAAKDNPKANAGDDIWIGTADGLVHLQNEHPVLLTVRDGLPGNAIRGLAQTTDGSIWVWTEAGLARWASGRFETIALPANLPAGSLTSMAADGSSALWMGTTGGVAIFRRGRWLPGPDGIAKSTPVTPSAFRTALVAAVPGGDVLIAAANGVYLAHEGDWSRVLSRDQLPLDEVSFLARLANGAIAVGTKSAVTLARDGRTIGQFSVSNQLPGTRIDAVYADREGCLWIGTNRGLARIAIDHRGTAAIELLPASDPLATHAVVAFLEDREGDLWIGTETSGLHILRDSRFRTLGTGEGLNSDNLTAIVEGADKTLWIGSRDSGLNRISATQTTSLTTATGLLSDVILSLASAPNGTLWVGTPDGLNEIGPSRITSYTSADGLPDDFIRSLLVAPDHSLWIGTRRGLTHFANGHFKTWTGTDGLGSDLVGALAATPDGDLWIATLNGLTRLHQNRLHNYTTADGLSSNIITALATAPHGMLWVGTQSNGLNLWDGTRFTALRSTTGSSTAGAAPLPAVIHAIINDDHGHLWLATDSGLTRADSQALLACAQQNPCRLNPGQLTSFTTVDGLRSRETSSDSHPTAVLTSDGHLWFTSPRGAIVADPQHFPANPLAPPVSIERFAVDDRDVDPAAHAAASTTRLGAGHMRFQFDYSGLSFAAPQKVRYQYKLEGFDHDWIEAGTRRTAYYTAIPPGNYRFRVRAAMTEAGFTSDATSDTASYAPSEAALSFVLLPHFYQTLWFRTLAVLAVAALIFLVFRRRVLRVEREFRAVMAERNRIAREIHDTLAQGYVGISLQLEILGELLRHNKPEAAAKHLALTQGLVREGLDDARQSIWALRSQDAGEKTLPIRLRRQVEQAQDQNLNAEFNARGAYRALPPDLEQEFLRIAQEAIQNVKRHAHATRMTVILDYHEDAIVLTISDNGKGFTVESSAGLGAPHLRNDNKPLLHAANAADGHYGLIGMQERAAILHGGIAIESAPGQGTTVRLTVPTAPRPAIASSVSIESSLSHTPPALPLPQESTDLYTSKEKS
jgi:signal transduction histidine kinase/ligand-binding sensor domain-containing protein